MTKFTLILSQNQIDVIRLALDDLNSSGDLDSLDREVIMKAINESDRTALLDSFHEIAPVSWIEGDITQDLTPVSSRTDGYVVVPRPMALPLR